MKRNLFFMTSLMAIAMLYSCNEQESNELGYMPFRSSSEGKWGLISTDGTVLFEEEFKDEPTVVMNDRFMVKNGNKMWEIYTASDNPEKIGEDYIDICDFTANVTPAVKKNEKIKLIDKEGNEIAVLDKIGKKNIDKCSKFIYGYAIVMTEDDKCGIINTKGAQVIDAKYKSILPISSKNFIAFEENDMTSENNNFVLTVLDAKGNIVSNLSIGDGQKYTDIDLEASNEKYIAVSTTVDGEKQWGYIDLNKEVKIKPSSKIKGLGQLKGDKFIFYNGENWGVMGFDGTTVIRPKYDNLRWASETLLIAYDSEERCYMLVNTDGDKLTTEKYLRILPFYNGNIAPAKVDDNSWAFINTKGEEERIKNLPDIYDIEEHYASDIVSSDFVDVDAIVGSLQLAKNGIKGLSVDLIPLQLVKAYNEFADDKVSTTANDAGHIDQLRYSSSKRGIDTYLRLYYDAYMTDYDYNYNELKWSNERPAYVEAEISGYKLDGKTQILYSKIAAVVKSYGKVYKENSGAVIVKINDNRGWIVINTGSEVRVRLINSNYYHNESIDAYAKDGETTRESAESQRAKPDFVEEVEEIADSCVEVIEEIAEEENIY